MCWKVIGPIGSRGSSKVKGQLAREAEAWFDASSREEYFPLKFSISQKMIMTNFRFQVNPCSGRVPDLNQDITKGIISKERGPLSRDRLITGRAIINISLLPFPVSLM